MLDCVELVKCQINMLRDMGFELTKDMKILDFGCGAGKMVEAFRSLGYNAYGTDIIDCTLLDAEHFKKIDFQFSSSSNSNSNLNSNSDSSCSPPPV